MVTSKKIATLLFFIALIPLSLFCQEVSVASEIDNDGVVGIPLKGTVTVTHDKNSEVKEGSFRLGMDPLSVEFVKKVQISPSSPLTLSIYTFTLTPEAPGLQILPEITVTVDGQGYSSIPRSYMIRKTAEPVAGNDSENQVVLRFETIVDGPTTLYPGQRVKVGYRFVFNYSLDLTKEEIPLLKGKDFRKIGGKQAEEYTRDGLNYLEATQVLEAITPGEFEFQPGVIEGRAYRMNRAGEKEYANAPSHAESVPLTIQVLPFPEVGKPTSFNGAIGESFHFTVSLMTAREVTVGDKMELLIKVDGKGELTNIPLPTVCCQPGYSGFFRLSDLPPMENVRPTSKTFTVEMRPLTAKISEIPSLEFAYFNPKTEGYATLKSNPIPITVHPLKTKPLEEALYTPAEGSDPLAEETTHSPEAIEIEGVFLLSAHDLDDLTFGTWKVLLIIPFGIAVLFLQLQYKRYQRRQRKRVKTVKSQDLFAAAMEEEPGSPRFFLQLQRAFLTRLVERGDIESADVPLDKIPEDGMAGKVRTLLHDIELHRFSGVGGAFGKPFLEQTETLFSELKQ